MIPEGQDGINHINIYSKGLTELGRWLSNFTYAPIELKGLGNFDSIEALWYYLCTHDDRLRHTHGFQAKKLGKEILSKLNETEQFHVDDNFKEIIKSALKVKLRTYPDKLNEFIYSDQKLPFVHYYEYNGKRVDAGFIWIPEFFNDLRVLLYKNHIPF